MFAALFRCFVVFASVSLAALAAPSSIEVPDDCIAETICKGLDAAVSLDVARDGRVFVAEQLGAVRVIQDGKLLEEPFVQLDVNSVWERGVIGVALHPKFPEQPYVYVHYVRAAPVVQHVVSRFTADAPSFNTCKRESERILVEGEDQAKLKPRILGAHQGGPMRFGPDGKLYVTIGEHTLRDPAQATDTLYGKLLRFNDDGSIPADNPFASSEHALQRGIFAWGLRNPFGLAVETTGPGNGRLFVTDVGQELFEEINVLERGGNYGWPAAEGMVGHREGFVKPLHTYNRALGVCIAGAAFVPKESSGLPERFRGKLIFADYMGGWLRALDPANPGTSEEFAKKILNPIDLAMAPDGSLLVLARNAWLHDHKLKRNSGMLVRIRSKG
jgi:glucose/arabinose dehydrogenase